MKSFVEPLAGVSRVELELEERDGAGLLIAIDDGAGGKWRRTGLRPIRELLDVVGADSRWRDRRLKARRVELGIPGRCGPAPVKAPVRSRRFDAS